MPVQSPSRLIARKELPGSYALSWRFDIHQKKELVFLNLLGVLLLVLSWIGFTALGNVLRPETAVGGFISKSGDLNQLLVFLGILIPATIVMLVIHEGFHGFFFWLFSRSRPRFAFKIYYASAAAPEWVFPRWQYNIIALAPLVGITLLGIAGLAWLPASLLLPTLLMMVFNASGAVGDLWVFGHLLLHPADTYIKDYGDTVEFYRPS